MVSALMQQHLTELTDRVDRAVAAEASGVTPAQRQTICDKTMQRLGRMKWVDEHVIATALLLLHHEQPELFTTSEEAAIKDNGEE
ncbi:MAG: hypothetical protein HQL60_05145 [Magnetococcales bacterium]|nr:hypothetical protein [Magnetococcales bacterium]